MPPSTVVDIHAHFVPEGFLRLIETEGAAHGLTLRPGPDGPFIMIGSVPVGPITPGHHDLGRRLRDMDRQGVTMHALSLMPPMVYWADAALGQRLARLVNEAMAEAARAHPDRVVGLATLPMQAPAAAVAEVGRAIEELGLRGVYLGTNVRGTDLDDPSLIPVFARIAELGVPVLLHPLNVLGGPRVGAYYLHNLLGNPFDTAVAGARLVFGGVLDRFPSLRVCLPHAGGALPYLLGRLDRGYRVRPECRHLPRPPSAYVDRFFFDTIAHSPVALRYLIDVVGADRVMLGSDYCFDMGYEDPMAALKAVEPLSDGDRARILGGNALRFLGLG
jgi:aminocarboxymuconate-semialdehyde decarboxylase